MRTKKLIEQLKDNSENLSLPMLYLELSKYSIEEKCDIVLKRVYVQKYNGNEIVTFFHKRIARLI